MSDLRPADVRGANIAGAFGEVQIEAAVMFIVGYLDAHDLSCDTEFSWHEFINWVVAGTDDYVCMRYVSTLYMFDVFYVVVDPIRRLFGKYISRRDSDGVTYLTMTPTLVDLVQRFAA